METETKETIVMKGDRATYTKTDLDQLALTALSVLEKPTLSINLAHWEVEVADAGCLLRVYYYHEGIKSVNVAL